MTSKNDRHDEGKKKNNQFDQIKLEISVLKKSLCWRRGRENTPKETNNKNEERYSQ